MAAKTPSDVVQKLTTEVLKALKQADIVVRLSEPALDQGAMPREKFTAMVTADFLRWGAVIKAAGMKLD